MKIIKVKNGLIRLENPIFGENLFIGVLALNITTNLINIETDCVLKVGGNIVKLKTGKYTIDEINKIVSPLIISIEGDKLNIKSSVFFKLDEKLDKYLGVVPEEKYYFNTMKNRIVGDFPLKFTEGNLKDEVIQINQKCSFIIGRNGHITPYELHPGLYTLKDLEKKLNIYSDSEHELNTIVTLENKLLKITSPFNIGFDSYLSDCLGFEYIKKGEEGRLVTVRGEKYVEIFGYIWPTEKDVDEGKKFFTTIGVKSVNLNNDKYLSNIEGNIYFDNSLIINIPRMSYTIDQLNFVLKMDLKVTEENLIEIKSGENSFMLDNKLCVNLGVKFVNFTKIGNYPTSKPLNIPLELHCNIIEKSITNHEVNEHIHCEENLLFIFNNPQDNLLLKPTSVTYIPVSAKEIQNIKIDVYDLKGNIFNKFTEFIVYLSLINNK